MFMRQKMGSILVLCLLNPGSGNDSVERWDLKSTSPIIGTSSFLHHLAVAKERKQYLAWPRSVLAPFTLWKRCLRTPQVLHRHMITEVEHPTLGKVRQAGIPIKLSDTPGRIRSLAPLRGQHTEEILLELEYTEEQIMKLQEAGEIYLRENPSQER